MLRFLPLLIVLLPNLVLAADKVDFAHDVLPILKTKCAKCHTQGTYKGGVSFDTRADLLKSEAIVAGKSADSSLIERVTSTDPEVRMPLEGKPLDAKEIATLRAWIDQGAAWQEGFSFAKAAYTAPLGPRWPTLPPARAGRNNPIDRIIDAYFEQHKTETPNPVSDAEFLRRVSLDVVGLLPTPAELDTFTADPNPEKRSITIRTVLGNNRAYAEHWLTFWNDLLRNDYVGTGYIDGGRKQITAWLYRALLDNKPYDEFVRELINPSAESEGFVKGIKWRGNVNASQVQELQFAQNISQVFLGINMKCASCHDSFIDNWKLADAYGLAAIIADQPLEIHRCDKPTGAQATAKFVFPELGDIDASKPKAERLARTAQLMTDRQNGRFARTIVNRVWQRLMGRGIVHPVDVMSNEPWSADLLDYLAYHLAVNGYDLKKTIELIVSSRAYQSRSEVLSDEPPAADYVFRGPIARRMTAEQFLDAVWRITGRAPEKTAADFGDRGKEPIRAALVVADPLMRSLGRPNREQVVTTRPAELSTLEAIDLTNGRILADLISQGVRDLRKEHADWDVHRIVDWVYRTALGRKPTDEERKLALEIAGSPMTDDGLGDLLWTVCMLPEFQMIR